MKKGIKDLAYLIKEAVKNKAPKPIVFLGAGASVSGGIPLAGGIIKKILKDFEDNPAIIDLEEDKKNDYYELMSALTPKQRRALFQTYIKEAKVNIAHIYLAQLIQEGYVDYVLTVNFDDLLLRAAGLFNYTLPTYDISNVNSFTTTTFQEESIIYLHGQHYGEWLLNSKGELDKVKTPVKSLFDKICHDRTWIIVGYSGEDEVFDCIKNFSSFDNELYWVGYLEHDPSEEVKTDLLNIPTKNAHLISGYDADTFFLDLHSKLGLETPKIMNKPFSFLQDMMKEIKEPEEKSIIDEHKKLYEIVSERMKITNQWIDESIEQFENTDSIENFEQKIIDAIIKKDFNDELAKYFEDTIIEKNYSEAKEILSGYYNNWGIITNDLAELKNDESLYNKAVSNYKKAVKLNPYYSDCYNNWGIAIQNLAELKNDENLYKEALKKHQKANQLNPNDSRTYNNLGSALQSLAKIKNDENLYKQAFSKYEKASQLKPDDFSTYTNWGIAIQNLAELKNDENLYKKAFIKYKKANQLKLDDYRVYINWGNAIQNLAKLKKDENLYEEAFTKYKKASQLKVDDSSIYNNWGTAILALAELKNDENLYEEALTKYKKANEIKSDDSDIYNNWGNAIQRLSKLLNDKNLYKESFNKYQKAIQLKPDYSNAYHNWTAALNDYSKLIIDKKENTSILKQAKEKALLAYKYGNKPYNLSCTYALLNEKENALKYLKETLDNKQISKEYALKDKDWQHYLEDEDFKNLVSNY